MSLITKLRTSFSGSSTSLPNSSSFSMQHIIQSQAPKITSIQAPQNYGNFSTCRQFSMASMPKIPLKSGSVVTDVNGKPVGPRDEMRVKHVGHLLNVGDLNTSLTIIDKLAKQGIPLSNRVYTTLFQQIGRMRHGFPIEGILSKYVDQMLNLKIQPDPLTWNAVLDALAKRGHMHTAQQYIDRMPELGLPVTVRVFNSLLLGAKTRVEISKIFQDMKAAGIQPDERTFLLAIEAAARDKDAEFVEHLLTGLREMQVEMQPHTLAAIKRIWDALQIETATQQ